MALRLLLHNSSPIERWDIPPLVLPQLTQLSFPNYRRDIISGKHSTCSMVFGGLKSGVVKQEVESTPR